MFALRPRQLRIGGGNHRTPSNTLRELRCNFRKTKGNSRCRMKHLSVRGSHVRSAMRRSRASISLPTLDRLLCEPLLLRIHSSTQQEYDASALYDRLAVGGHAPTSTGQLAAFFLGSIGLVSLKASISSGCLISIAYSISCDAEFYSGD